jgi:hypothetical protein
MPPRPTQARRLLNFVLSNCSWENGEGVTTFRQTFDMLAETTAIAARHGAGNTAKSAKTSGWRNQKPFLFGEKQRLSRFNSGNPAISGQMLTRILANLSRGA